MYWSIVGRPYLLARRLIESGVRFVTTVNGQSIIWDTHADNFGRLEKTLVPPIINAATGRDHWPRCYSMILAGGGIRGGQVIGESDKIGAVPKSRPITPADVHASSSR